MMFFFLIGFTSVSQDTADMQQLLNRLKALEKKQKPSVHSMKKSIANMPSDNWLTYMAEIHGPGNGRKP